MSCLANKKVGGDLLLKIYRKQKKLTQAEAAERLGIVLRQYQRLESGESFATQKVLNSLEDLFEKPQRVLLAKNAEEVPKYMKHYLN
ncbi:helix-turn-helix domain-containing protein [Enterococcus rotai]|uniref:helix-turn-helix domain-containing protein n=1 Tax=Enterococcus rotai TaxID=118060 RepID=UPI0032B33998